MEAVIENCIRKNVEWSKLPEDARQSLGQKTEYDKRVLEFSIKNQFRFRANLVRFIAKNEKQYYKELLQYSTNQLMLFPYHLSDFIVSAMRITPFQYYVNILQNMLNNEKNYDTLPNFTAADCLRLLGIGRNQYLELMIHYRASKRFFSLIKKPNKDLLPVRPVKNIPIEPWWILNAGYITEDDIRYMTTVNERKIIDRLMSEQNLGTLGPLKAGEVDQEDVRNLYLKGLIYLDVPIEDDDLIVVPPLEGFVMNRVTGDYFETLLYKIFISIDEKTTVKELADMLNIELNLVKMAVSMYCRLGFAYKKATFSSEQFHPSWVNEQMIQLAAAKKTGPENSVELFHFMNELTKEEEEDNEDCYEIYTSIENNNESPSAAVSAGGGKLSRDNSISYEEKRIALVYDSTLAAFLMMGNLSPNLKTHAITMFEVGKLLDESLDSLLIELNQINERSMGEEGFEAEIYFMHAILLCKTILFLRNNPKLRIPSQTDDKFTGLGLDLIRCESLLNLEEDISQRLLYKNYSLLFTLCPLSNETKMINSFNVNHPIAHFGPTCPLMNSVWFKLFIYHRTGFGPPSLLIARGQRLSVFPIDLFGSFHNLLVTPFNKDSLVINVGNALEVINDYLQHSPVLIQGYSNQNTHFNTNKSGGLSEEEKEEERKEIQFVPFPLIKEFKEEEKIHPAIQHLDRLFNLRLNCGFVRLVSHPAYNLDEEYVQKVSAQQFHPLQTEFQDWTVLDVHFGIPLFDKDLNGLVCQSIEESGLCDFDNLSEVIKFNRRLNEELEQFVRNFTSDFNPSPSKENGNQLPMPTVNLVFNNGKLCKID